MSIVALLMAAFLFFVAAVALAAAAAEAAPQSPEVAQSAIYTWLQEHRTAAYWLAPMLMVVVAILPIPAEIPAAMNGMLFGTIMGIVLTWAGAVIGAQISYELARCFGAKASRRFVAPEALAKLEKLKRAEAPVLLMLRLTPIVAFTVVNWASGLLRVRRSTFMWTTAVGILPGTIAFTASGSAVAWLYDMHPSAVTLGVVTIGVLFLIAAWWRHRGAPTHPPTDG